MTSIITAATWESRRNGNNGPAAGRELEIADLLSSLSISMSTTSSG